MPYTVALVEGRIVAKVGGWMALANMPLTHVGTNASLAGPILKALLYVGITPLDITVATDADLANLTTQRMAEKYLDAAYWETCQAILGNFPAFDQRIKDAEQKLSQVTAEIRSFMAALNVQSPYKQDAAISVIIAGVPMPNDPRVPCSVVQSCNAPYPPPYPGTTLA